MRALVNCLSSPSVVHGAAPPLVRRGMCSLNGSYYSAQHDLTKQEMTQNVGAKAVCCFVYIV